MTPLGPGVIKTRFPLEHCALDLIYLLPLLPATGAVINGLIGMRSFGRRSVATIACATISFALLLSIWILAKLIALPPDARVHDVVLGDWIPAIPSETSTGIQMFVVTWTLRLDLLSAILAVVVTGVGVLVHWYAAASMRDAPRQQRARVFSCLGLGVGFMLMFVLAGNFLVLLAGWEGMALCAYLLSGAGDDRETPATSGMTAFLVNQISACALLVGMLVVYFAFGTIDFREVAAAGSMPAEAGGFGALSAIRLALFVAAVSSALLARFEPRVVKACVNGLGAATQIAAWIAYMFEKHVIDRIADSVARTVERTVSLARGTRTGRP